MGALLYVAADALAGAWPGFAALAGPAAAAALLATAQDAVTEFGGARPGDKTLLDALDAARAACAALPRDTSLAQTLRRAAEAARAGAAATAGMDARVGRASRLGDKARGTPDAGATSFAIAMNAMANAYVERGMES